MSPTFGNVFFSPVKAGGMIFMQKKLKRFLCLCSSYEIMI